MTSVAELARLRRIQVPGEGEKDVQLEVQRLAAGRSPQELAALVACLTRGTPWREANAWVSSARGDLSDTEYRRALELFTDSALLSWSECAGIAGALIYRGWPPQSQRGEAKAHRERRPSSHSADLVVADARRGSSG